MYRIVYVCTHDILIYVFYEVSSAIHHPVIRELSKIGISKTRRFQLKSRYMHLKIITNFMYIRHKVATGCLDLYLAIRSFSV